MTLANKVSIFPRKLQRSVLIEDVTLREMIFEFWVATALACHGHARAAAGCCGSGYARAATAAHSVVADSQNIVWWPHSKTKSQKNIFTHFRCTLHKVSFEEFSSYFCSRKIFASQRRTVRWNNFSSSRNIISPRSFSAPSSSYQECVFECTLESRRVDPATKNFKKLLLYNRFNCLINVLLFYGNWNVAKIRDNYQCAYISQEISWELGFWVVALTEY